jgi:hypothetical protein
LKSDYPRPLSAQKLESLVEKAGAKGSVLVIVGLRVAFKPEGELPDPQAAQAQRQAIARAQQTLLKRLADCGYKIGPVKKFEYIPFLSMEADASTLMHLNQSSDIVSIEEDVPVSLTNG